MSVVAQENTKTASFFRRGLRWLAGKWWRIPLVLLLLGLLFPVLLTTWIYVQTQDKIYDSTAEVDQFDAALLLGTSPYVSGGLKNLYFVNRIQATVALYKARKIKKVIISGDNQHHSYNEPREMYRALIKNGVSAEDIIWDFAGFRTFDSVVRAYKVFGQKRLLIVSQRDHLQRAMFIADHHDMDAWGYPAQDPPQESFWMQVREPLARLKAFADLYILQTAPRHLGDSVSIFEDQNIHTQSATVPADSATGADSILAPKLQPTQ